MICGLGLDVVDLRAFRAQLAVPGSAFEEGAFTPAERREARLRPDADPARHLAARYAAKEALLKALGADRWGEAPRRAGVDLREIEVQSDAWGRPALVLHGAVAAMAGEGRRWWLSLSHDGEVVAAVVVGERVAGPGGG